MSEMSAKATNPQPQRLKRVLNLRDLLVYGMVIMQVVAPIPIFGLLANLGCMLFYLIGPFSVAGMSWKEPYIALGIAAVWGIYGLLYFRASSKKRGKEIFLSERPATVSS